MVLVGFDVVAENAASAAPAAAAASTHPSASATGLRTGLLLREPEPLELVQPEQSGRNRDEQEASNPAVDRHDHVADPRDPVIDAAERSARRDVPALDRVVRVALRDDVRDPVPQPEADD